MAVLLRSAPKNLPKNESLCFSFFDNLRVLITVKIRHYWQQEWLLHLLRWKYSESRMDSHSFQALVRLVQLFFKTTVYIYVGEDDSWLHSDELITFPLKVLRYSMYCSRTFLEKISSKKWCHNFSEVASCIRKSWLNNVSVSGLRNASLNPNSLLRALILLECFLYKKRHVDCAFSSDRDTVVRQDSYGKPLLEDFKHESFLSHVELFVQSNGRNFEKNTVVQWVFCTESATRCMISSSSVWGQK